MILVKVLILSIVGGLGAMLGLYLGFLMAINGWLG
ncbi:hypothetical protein SEA_COMRADE_223 [Streptomyces phage Comrade]|uniref:Uncharacterized protein n=3 Tax=Gilsonvirus comrade TaxID=2846395 RepID=A0A345MEC4_9CAUD|nr:hypothetical protein HWB84_gp055 [Streptomyces phage Comrade]AXH68905.1 hypothetical protein SEA_SPARKLEGODDESS_226 [Streptomyces phage SparkleGoddess]QQO39879.1 membrane protein [Streptomyces phage Belfort]QZE11788.1 membrane protein [Streptomyces phage Karp]UTN92449.1 hypothetical protein SEA_STIGMA_225 [Streptomyces phage Stigma]AXQ63503.1 hypothetical protein SEA_COMRADE_223 [Streptomyces phage Comrade]